MILRQGLTLAALGVGAGIVLALGAARLLASLLFGVRATDAPTYIAIIIVLGCTAALASWLPARRAARVDPVEALRAE
jgi:putative ABC transport system permease protein